MGRQIIDGEPLRGEPPAGVGHQLQLVARGVVPEPLSGQLQTEPLRVRRQWPRDLHARRSAHRCLLSSSGSMTETTPRGAAGIMPTGSAPRTRLDLGQRDLGLANSA